MTDIIFFDYWTRGTKHFTYLNKKFQQAGYSTCLVHVGSFRGEKFENNTCHIDGICCHDLAKYKNSLVLMLKKEQPKLVVLINNQTQDKIIVRACRALNIKTVYFMNGVIALPEEFQEGAQLMDSIFGVMARIKRASKYLKLYKQYLQAAKLNSVFDVFDTEIFLYLLRLTYSPGKTMFGHWRYKDSYADVALVYSENNREQFVKQFGYPEAKVKVVGNCNLDDLFLKNKEFNAIQDQENQNDKYVVYIESGFSKPGSTVKGWSEDLVAAEVKKISDVFERYGYRLKLKLHPSCNYSALTASLKDEGNIDIIRHCDLTMLIIQSSLVLGQSSSVLMMALAVHKPIILTAFPPLEIQLPTYLNRGFGVPVFDYQQLEQYVSDGSAFKANYLLTNATKMNEFVGPFDGLAKARMLEESMACISAEC